MGLSPEEDLTKQLDTLLNLSKNDGTISGTVRDMCLRELNEQDLNYFVGQIWRISLDNIVRIEVLQTLFRAIGYEKNVEICGNM